MTRLLFRRLFMQHSGSFRVSLSPSTENRFPVMHVYEVRPRKDHRGVDLISNALPFGRLWYGEPNAASNAVGYAMHYSRLLTHGCKITRRGTIIARSLSASAVRYS